MCAVFVFLLVDYGLVAKGGVKGVASWVWLYALQRGKVLFVVKARTAANPDE